MNDKYNMPDVVYAYVNMTELESDLMVRFGVTSGRFPSTEEMFNRDMLDKFVKLTRKYIVSESHVSTLIEQARKEEREKLAKAIEIHYEIKNIDRRKDPGKFPQDLSIDEVLFVLGRKREQEDK